MAHKGPDVSHRTPRKRALEIGTQPAGFEGGLEICGACGHPVLAGVAHGHYADNAPPANIGGQAAQPQGSPFKDLKGGK